MRAVASLFAFAASALAITVTQPTNSTGWFTSGQNTVAWDAVSTDPTNFTVVLVNMNKFPTYSQVLDALVVTSSNKISVGPPSAGWPTGSGYQVNLVANAESLNTILAQSNQFTFVAASGSSSQVSSTSASSGTSSGGTLTVSSPSSASTVAVTDSGDLNPTTSDTTTSPSTTNAAVSTGVKASFFGLVALVGAMLA